jgi:acyl-CoA synthetase (AMP-forming)/AMP-acid ligase II
MSALASELSVNPARRTAGGQLSELIRARSSALGGESYIEHARADRGLTFADLARAVERWGNTLEESGVAPGATVGLVIADPIDFSVAFLGTIASGRWAAPLDPSTPASGLDAALARVQAHIVFSDPPGAPEGLRGRFRRCSVGVIGDDRRAQGHPPAPGTSPPHGTRRLGPPSTDAG